MYIDQLKMTVDGRNMLFKLERSVVFFKFLTVQYRSSEWSHTRISSTDLKVRTTLYSIINSTTWKYCSIAFNWMIWHSRDSSTHLKVWTTLHSIYNKQYHMKVLLNSFHLNGHTLRFHPLRYPIKVLLTHIESYNLLVEHSHSNIKALIKIIAQDLTFTRESRVW